jgi:hypothetical protein
MNYAKNVPRDQGGGALLDYPSPFVAGARSVLTNANVSSMLNLNPNTTQIEIGSFGSTGCVIRWVPNSEWSGAGVAPYGSVVSSGVGANYDHFIPSSNWRQFVVPKDTAGLPTGQAGSVNGLYQRIAIINAGAASSVLVTEY